MKLRYLFCLLIVFFSEKGLTQVNNKVYIIKVHYNRDTLKILFKNKGKKSMIVPQLSNRVGSDMTTMYEKFYKNSKDTIFITLSSEIDKDLYTINTSHKTPNTKGRLFYLDKKLPPNRTFWTSVRIKKLGNPKVLVLQFEKNKWISSID